MPNPNFARKTWLQIDCMICMFTQDWSLKEKNVPINIGCVRAGPDGPYIYSPKSFKIVRSCNSDIIWPQMITNDIKWQKMTTDDNRWQQMSSDDIRWHHMTSDCIRWFVQELLEYWGIGKLKYWMDIEIFQDIESYLVFIYIEGYSEILMVIDRY